MKGKILIVDDSRIIRMMMSEFLLSLDYEVDQAKDGIEALEVMEQNRYDLIISDINMPRMKGFELLKIVREKYPHTKRVLITSYNVEDYFDLAMKHNVGNIIAKTAPFSFDDVQMVVETLMAESFFGLERHLSAPYELMSQKVHDFDSIEPLAQKATQSLTDEDTATRLRLVIVELVTNAISHGARQQDPNIRDEYDSDFCLSEDEAIEFSWGKDPEKVAISVADPYGRLTKKDVLYWLTRQTAKDGDGFPLGVFDTHGRGLFIARSYVDRLIINIKSDTRTELVALTYLGQKFEGFKPLYINEA